MPALVAVTVDDSHFPVHVRVHCDTVPQSNENPVSVSAQTKLHGSDEQLSTFVMIELEKFTKTPVKWIRTKFLK